MRLLPLCLLAACTPPVHPDSGADPAPFARAAWDPIGDDLVVPLRWVRGWETASGSDSWDLARGGLWWQLANLGAVPPPDEAAIDVLASGDDEVHFTLDLARVGFDPRLRGALREAVGFVHEADEVRLFGGLDAGAFFLRTLYEPWTYYRLTGACGSESRWEEAHLAVETVQYAVTESFLTEGDRLDTYVATPGTAAGIAHLVGEGEGSIADGSFVAVETESIDLMPNGMLRYAVYGAEGAIAPWGLASPAGQPGKCMWCHEDHLQEGDPGNTGAEGYVATAVFIDQIRAQQALVTAVRAELDTVVVFDPPDAHDHGEHLTETWLQPSPGRLAREWSVEESEVRDRVAAAGIPLFYDDEYPEFGELILRADADRLFAELLPTLADDPTHPFYGWDEPFDPVETSATSREPVAEPLVWGDEAQLPCW